MKGINRMLYRFYILVIGISCITFTLFAQNIPSDYTVARWFGFKKAAVTYTFDDGTAKQFSIAIPLFDEYGYKATLFTVTDWSSNNWTKLQAAAANGHEVASHTVSHPHFNSISDSLLENELANSKSIIESKIQHQQCLTIAYPYCETGNIELVKKYYIAGRICSGQIEASTPADFYQISSLICGSVGTVKTSADFNSRVKSAASSGGWVVYLIHGIDNDGGYSPLSSDTLRKSLDYLKTNDSIYWVSTFLNVVCYIRERNCVSISDVVYGDTLIVATITDTLDNTIYSHPISLRRKLPAGWEGAIITQNNNSIACRIVEISGNKYLYFDVVPDAGNVYIKKCFTTDVERSESTLLPIPILFQNYPNPFNPTTTISFSLPKQDFVTIIVYNILGKEIETLVAQEYPAGYHTVMFNARNFSNGIYLYRLITHSYTATKSLIVMK